jgi:dienelactone hydrolase
MYAPLVAADRLSPAPWHLMKRLLPLLFTFAIFCAGAEPLPGTAPLQEQGDLAAKMVQGIHRYLDRETSEVTKSRAALWTPDTSSPEAWEKSMQPKRARLRQLLGMVDAQSAPRMNTQPPPLGREDLLAANGQREVNGRLKHAGVVITGVEWPVFRNVKGEGLLSDPGKDNKSFIVLPDCGTAPEQSFGITPGLPPGRQWANRIASLGHQVLAMPLVDRRPGAVMPEGRTSKFSQREVLWRAGFEMGRTTLGYEVSKVLATADWLCGKEGTLGIIGTGEGGWIALLAAALDTRITSVGMEGAFGPLEAQWSMPIDRTVFGLIREFGAAELAAMVAPRILAVRSADWPEVSLGDAGGGAPGHLTKAATEAVEHEIARMKAITGQILREGGRTLNFPAADDFLHTCMLPVWYEMNTPFAVPREVVETKPADEAARQARLFNNLLEDTQTLMRQAQKARGDYWKGADFSSSEKFSGSAKVYREKFWTDITGKLPPVTLPPNPRSRQIYETEKFTGWEIMLDVYPDVFSYGILLLPKDLKPGEKRAVVVCQHGLEGRPSDLADPKLDHPAYHTYGARLAEKGYIVFAPQNPYIGKTEFRQICRKAWPLGLSLWSFIVRQHETILTWLKAQPEVDASRIAFYGLSYGGKSAMRLPALLPDYCLSICSADYNEWIWKNVDACAPYSYLHTNEYDMVEWNMGNTFNYAELSWLIFPRPFMVERGHDDGVSCDEWVAYEFARTRRHYSRLGLGERAEIEFFNGPHTINGQGTFRFLDKWLTR